MDLGLLHVQEVLPSHGLHEGIDGDHAAYGRRFFAEISQQLVISAPRSDGLPGSVRISLEDDSRVIMVFAKEREVEADIFGEPVSVHHIPDIDEASHGGLCARARRRIGGLYQVLCRLHEVPDPEEQIPFLSLKSFALEEVFGGKIVLARDLVAQRLFEAPVHSQIFADPLEVLDVAHADLELGESRFQKALDQHRDHLSVRLGAGVVHELRPHLGGFLELTLQVRGVAVGAALIAEAERPLLVHKVLGRASCHGGRKVGPQHQCVPFFIEELVQLPRGGRPDLVGEHVKIFKGRRLKILVSVQMDLPRDPFDDRLLGGIFLSV